jgi:hypothetical protein
MYSATGQAKLGHATLAYRHRSAYDTVKDAFRDQQNST